VPIHLDDHRHPHLLHSKCSIISMAICNQHELRIESLPGLMRPRLPRTGGAPFALCYCSCIKRTVWRFKFESLYGPPRWMDPMRSEVFSKAGRPAAATSTMSGVRDTMSQLCTDVFLGLVFGIISVSRTKPPSFSFTLPRVPFVYGISVCFRAPAPNRY
jgi:hypothetical protein